MSFSCGQVFGEAVVAWPISFYQKIIVDMLEFLLGYLKVTFHVTYINLHDFRVCFLINSSFFMLAINDEINCISTCISLFLSCFNWWSSLWVKKKRKEKKIRDASTFD